MIYNRNSKIIQIETSEVDVRARPDNAWRQGQEMFGCCDCKLGGLYSLLVEFWIGCDFFWVYDGFAVLFYVDVNLICLVYLLQNEESLM